jgi:hypothetical protein
MSSYAQAATLSQMKAEARTAQQFGTIRQL